MRSEHTRFCVDCTTAYPCNCAETYNRDHMLRCSVTEDDGEDTKCDLLAREEG